MINGIFHTNYTPFNLEGSGTQKDGYQIREVKGKKVTRFGSDTEEYRANYTLIKCRDGLIYEFYVPAMIHPSVGTTIQVIPFETNTGDDDWPSLAYSIQGSIDGVHWNALPDPIDSFPITSASGAHHMLLLPLTLYKVRVVGSSNDGWFSVISN